mgnify:CR=1 FL=1
MRQRQREFALLRALGASPGQVLGSLMAQAGITPRAWRWADIERVRLVRMPWSTRLMLAPTSGPVRVVHAGTPALEEAFRVIAEMYSRGRT